MEYDGIVHTKNGEGVFTYAHIEKLREYGNPLNIIAQKDVKKSSLRLRQILLYLEETVAAEKR